MADTAHKTARELVEHHDKPKVLTRKIDQLAQMVLGSDYMACWTGAGISTSTGIPDYRGPNGKWTLEAQNKTRDEDIKVTPSLQATPSPTHMALVGLMRAGRLKKIISSNTDGLHLRSGIPAGNIAELHGNGNKTQCDKCKQFALIDDKCRRARGTKEHGTGQPCPYAPCRGELQDIIVNFGEHLLDEVFEDANLIGKKSDLLLGLGSSFRVITCYALEDIQSNGGKLVIVNLQETPFDDKCALRIFATCDEVMTALMAKLRLEIPLWVLHRYVQVSSPADPKLGVQTSSSVMAVPKPMLEVRGLDENGLPYAWIVKAEVLVSSFSSAKLEEGSSEEGGREPFLVVGSASMSRTAAFHPLQLLPVSGAGAPLLPIAAAESTEAPVAGGATTAVPTETVLLGCNSAIRNIRLYPVGHRGEQPVCVPCPAAGTSAKYCLQWDKLTGEWRSQAME